MEGNKARVRAVGSQGTPVDIATVQRAVGDSVTVSMCNWPGHLSRGTDDHKIAEVIGDCEAVILRLGWMPEIVFEKLQSLLIVVSHGSGVDKIDIGSASRNGVIVANTPGANTRSVVEHVICTTIALLRHIVWANTQLRSGSSWGESRKLGSEVYGKQVGLVGAGPTGIGVARAFRALGATVRMVTRSKHQGHDAEGNEYIELEELLSSSDIVSLHVPLNETTVNLIDRRRLSLMKSDAVLVNTSRGRVADESALLQALRTRQIGGAVIDVFPEEPPRNLDQLLTLDNLLVTPHLAGATVESLERIASTAGSMIRTALGGYIPEGSLNRNSIRLEEQTKRLAGWRHRGNGFVK